MKNPFSTFALAISMATSSLAVFASETYNYSYTYGDGARVTGSFVGTASGNLITGLSNISSNLNGIALAGSGNLYGSSYVLSVGWALGGAVASFDGTQNNLFFSDTDFPVQSNFTNFFSSATLYSPNTDVSQAYIKSPDAYHTDNYYSSSTYSASRWSVTPVPEPETYAMLLAGLGLIGVVARRRQLVARQ